MEFGLWTPARIDLGPLADQAEQAGFEYLHLYDSQTLYAELYACMALCAARTSKIKVGPGVTNPLTRMSAVTASGLATINQIAPGRTFLGIGSGYTSMKAMGLRCGRLQELRDYVEQVRALVRGEEANVEFEGSRTKARMIHGDHSIDDSFYNLTDPIPVYVGAGGPRSTELAGEIADGVILSIKSPADLDVRHVRERLALGARRAGRDVDDIAIIVMLNMYVLEAGERADSDRVKESVLGVWQSMIGSWAARRPPAPGKFDVHDEVPQEFVEMAEAYRRAVGTRDCKSNPLDSEAWYLTAYQGHAWKLHPDVVDHISNEFLRRHAFVASPDEIVSTLREWEDLGVGAVGPHVQHDAARGAEQVERLAEGVIPHFR